MYENLKWVNCTRFVFWMKNVLYGIKNQDYPSYSWFQNICNFAIVENPKKYIMFSKWYIFVYWTVKCIFRKQKGCYFNELRWNKDVYFEVSNTTQFISSSIDKCCLTHTPCIAAHNSVVGKMYSNCICFTFHSQMWTHFR